MLFSNNFLKNLQKSTRGLCDIGYVISFKIKIELLDDAVCFKYSVAARHYNTGPQVLILESLEQVYI